MVIICLFLMNKDLYNNIYKSIRISLADIARRYNVLVFDVEDVMRTMLGDENKVDSVQYCYFINSAINVVYS